MFSVCIRRRHRILLLYTHRKMAWPSSFIFGTMKVWAWENISIIFSLTYYENFFLGDFFFFLGGGAWQVWARKLDTPKSIWRIALIFGTAISLTTMTRWLDFGEFSWKNEFLANFSLFFGGEFRSILLRKHDTAKSIWRIALIFGTAIALIMVRKWLDFGEFSCKNEFLANFSLFFIG